MSKILTPSNKDFFFCYNVKLSNFLIKKGYSYVTHAIHPVSNQSFHMFYKSERLDALIKEYSSNFEKH